MSSHADIGAPAATSPAVTLAALSAQAWRLELPVTWGAGPRGGARRGGSRRGGEGFTESDERAAMLVDGLLTRVARGRGALDVALGELLAGLGQGDRVLRLGWSGIADYAREVLGVAGRTAQQMTRLARELRTRPLLAEAVRRGEVAPRRAVAVLPVAQGEDEARWVERARRETVRRLEAEVRAARGRGGDGAGPLAGAVSTGTKEATANGGVDDGDARDEAVEVEGTPEELARIEEALELAGTLLGPTSTRWERIEVLCQEFLGEHPLDDGLEADGMAGDGVGAAGGSLEEGRLDAVMAALEEETRCWELLERVGSVAAPEVPAHVDPHQLDAALRGLAALRDHWDELVGHLGLLVQVTGFWRGLGFASYSHYCSERLGLAGRTVERRAWLERRMYELPGLREALRDGRLSFEKACIVAGVATGDTAEGCIEYARDRTCIALRREVEAMDVAQVCAQGGLRVRMPRRVARLVDDAFAAVRRAAGRWLSPGECLHRIADHFVRTWEQAPPRGSPARRRVVERDRGFCQVPGCSRAAAHVHHVTYRSHGGGNEPGNLVSVCAAHHLHGIHGGWVRVSGVAPGALRWEVG